MWTLPASAPPGAWADGGVQRGWLFFESAHQSGLVSKPAGKDESGNVKTSMFAVYVSIHSFIHSPRSDGTFTMDTAFYQVYFEDIKMGHISPHPSTHF